MSSHGIAYPLLSIIEFMKMIFQKIQFIKQMDLAFPNMPDVESKEKNITSLGQIKMAWKVPLS